MRKNIILLLLLSALISMFITGCSSSNSETPEVEVTIDGKNSDDITGFTYLYDYGDGYRLYADNFTKIVYVMYLDNSGNGATTAKSSSLSPWISENGNYYYIDTKEKMIKELVDDNTIEDKKNSEDENDEENEDRNAISEESDSSSLDQSVTDQINQNQN